MIIDAREPIIEAKINAGYFFSVDSLMVVKKQNSRLLPLEVSLSQKGKPCRAWNQSCESIYKLGSRWTKHDRSLNKISNSGNLQR